jgi:hypothetical protein
MTLDFSGLTDDQLIALIREALQEAASRTLACKTAAQTVLFDEAEKARIAQEAVAQEAERIRREEAERIAREAAEAARRRLEAEQSRAQADKQKAIWEEKDRIAERFQELLGLPYAVTLQVWTKGVYSTTRKDKRIYVSAGKDHSDEVEYYHEGNAKQRPGSIKVLKKHKEREPEIKAACEEICKKWENLKVEIPAVEKKGAATINA